MSDAVNPDQGTGLSEHGAVDLLASMIDETGLVKQPDIEDDEGERAEPEAEQQDDDQAADDGQAEAPEAPQTVKVKVNGVEMEVPLSEVVAGYQKDADYRQKTAELAEQRRATESERQAVVQERAELSQRLTQADALLSAQLDQFGNVDWNELLEADPQAYLRARHQYDQTLAQIQQVKQQQGQLSQLMEQEQTQHMRQHLAGESERLLEALPEWRDESKAKAEKAQIRDYLLATGYGEDDVKSVADHRAIVMARKAMLYDQLLSKSTETTAKVKAAPLKVERPGAQAEPENRRGKEYAAQLRKTGRVDDAAGALLAMKLI